MLATLLQLFPGSQNWVLQKGLPATVCQNWALQKGLPPTVSQLGLAKGLKDDICHSRSFGWVLSRLCGWDAEPPCPSLLVLPAMHLQQGLDLEKKPPRSTCQCNVAAHGSTGATTANCTGGNLICPGRGGGTGTPEGKGDTAPLTEDFQVTKKLALQKG